MNNATSKPLTHSDSSGFEFVQELLDGDPTAAVNFDRLQKHPKLGYIIFEYLRCGEGQSITPYSSHPRRYWNKNKRKFLALYEVAQKLDAKLYLVNYAKRGTPHEDEILLIEVLEMTPNGISKEVDTRYTRAEFQAWFRKLNEECL